MIVAIIILAWLLLNTLATLVIICIDEGTPARASDWIGVGLSCILSPLTILFIIQPITTYIDKVKRKRKRK
jgi:hypothetical protein